MIRRIIILSISLILIEKNNAQKLCGFDALQIELSSKDSSYSRKVEQLEQKVQNLIRNHPGGIQRNDNTIYKIPIVVHVMHTGSGINTTYNPSDEQIKNAIAYLNSVYNGSYPGTQGAGDIEIQFELAKRTPSGDCTSGIDRVDASGIPSYAQYGVRSQTSLGCTELTLKDYARWNTNDYYNIWIVNKIDGNDGTAGPYIAGFAHFPTVSSDLDGTVILSTQMIAGEKTLPHEIGHSLFLYHTFQGSSNANDCPSNLFCSLFGDRVCDTDPVSENQSNGIYDFSCRTGNNPCTGAPYNLNTESNYMAYTVCYTLFTQGQKDRMLATMALGSRQTLVRDDNPALISPKADLIVRNQETTSATVSPGNMLTVFLTEENNGALPANPNYVNIHLSQDSILTPGANGDIYIDQLFVNQDVAPLSQTLLLNKQITIPLNILAGTYYLFFAADGTNIVDECIDDNNFATVTITILPGLSSGSKNYKIWFDAAYSTALTYPLGNSTNYTIQRYIPVSSLNPGLHVLHFQLNSDSLSSSINSSFFYKSSNIAPNGNGKFEYWIDNNYTQRINRAVSNTGNLFLLDSIATSGVSDGLHLFNIRFKPTNTLWSSVSSNFFYKTSAAVTGIAQYEYWFDNDYENKTTVGSSASNYLLLLNDISTASLPAGLHQFHIRFRPNGENWSSISTSLFYLSPALVTSNAAYEYWTDDNYAARTTISIPAAGSFSLQDNINTTNLTNGLHTVHFRFNTDGKNWSVTSSSFFYKDNSSLVPINNLARFVYWFDSDWQHPQTIAITGINDLHWTLQTDVEILSPGRHLLSFSTLDERGHWSSIVSDSFTRAVITAPNCLSGSRQINCNIIAPPGSIYQWQVDTGTGFTPISDNIWYSGSATETLTLVNTPTTWYGYKYRCYVTGSGSPITGPVYELKFSAIWTGAVDNAWENPANWNCSFIPDENTDVYVNAGLPRYIEVNSNAACRSIFLQPGTAITVKTGQTLLVTGKQ